MTGFVQQRKSRVRYSLSEDKIAVLELLLETWPQVFDLAEPVPLAIGIDRQITTEEACLIGPELQQVLGWYCRRIHYLQAVARGGKRARLDDKPADEVDEIARAAAQEMITKFNLQHRWRRADWPAIAAKGGA